jgi:hypothetical protein
MRSKKLSQKAEVQPCMCTASLKPDDGLQPRNVLAADISLGAEPFSLTRGYPSAQSPRRGKASALPFSFVRSWVASATPISGFGLAFKTGTEQDLAAAHCGSYCAVTHALGQGCLKTSVHPSCCHKGLSLMRCSVSCV